MTDTTRDVHPTGTGLRIAERLLDPNGGADRGWACAVCHERQSEHVPMVPLPRPGTFACPRCDTARDAGQEVA